jgi:hypothetical protein
MIQSLGKVYRFHAIEMDKALFPASTDITIGDGKRLYSGKIIGSKVKPLETLHRFCTSWRTSRTEKLKRSYRTSGSKAYLNKGRTHSVH